ncbi:MAG: cache domain-containing protein [Pseudomonadota bacterium]
MANKRSISTTFLFNLLLVTVISIGLLGCLWTWQQYVGFGRESTQLREMMLTNYKNLLKTQVQRSVDYIEYRKSLTEARLRDSIQARVAEAYDIAINHYETCRDCKSPQDIQSTIKESLRPMRFNRGRGYFFIVDLEGTIQLRGDRPELEGKNLLSVQGGPEARVIQDMIALCRQQGEGFYRYDWSKPDIEGGAFPKIAFVKLFAPYGWIIGTGAYLDDFEATIKAEVLSYLGTIRFGKDGYVFIAQWDGLDLTGPAKGRNMLGVTDPDGVKIVQELIALAKSGGGYLKYVMPRFKGKKPDPKLSYVQGIKDWQWYVGAGIYIDDIEMAIAAKHAEMTREMVKSVIQIAAVLLGLTLLTVFWARQTARNVRISFDRFTTFFDKGARESAVIDPGGMRYEEFELLAQAANQMIEARIVARDALQENKEWLQSILDSIQAGVVVIDPQTHTIIELNQAAVEMIGTTKDRLIDTICHNHICPNDIGACPVTDRGLNVEQSDRELLTADGTRMPILKTVNRATINGKDYLIESFLDMSDKKRLESMLLQAQKMEAIGTLAGGIAHDFNNILSPIMAYSEMGMLDFPPDDPIHHSFQHIYHAAERARDLVKQILTFARTKKENRIPLRASLVVNEALKFLRSTIPSTIKIQYDCAADQDTVLADLTQMNQIVMNLCTNATQAMRDKAGALEVTLCNEAVGHGETTPMDGLNPGQYLRLTVRDSGSGIPADIIDKIFDPYFTTKGPGEGTGLGLAVVHGIVKSYGGNITVESTAGEGTTFHILLPVIEADVTTDRAPEVRMPGGSERILFVDDEKTTIDSLQSVLERLGYHVTARTSSLEAFDTFRRGPDGFDLVITDMTMPEMTGKALAEALIAIRPDIPIILCTGFSDQIDEKRAQEIGIRAFVMKPVAIHDLAQLIRKTLDDRSGILKT